MHKKTNREYDTIIVGAGVAGLRCAKNLQEKGFKILLLEARNRLGGRAFSHTFSGHDVIEYGAEFIHGAHEEILKTLERNNRSYMDVLDEHLFFKNGKKQDLSDFWSEIEKLSKLLNPSLKKDRSLKEFLEAHKSRISPRLRDVFTSYMEGFQAVDLNLAGEKAMSLAEGSEVPELNSQSQFRYAFGYSDFVSILKKEAKVSAGQIKLNAVVQSITADKLGLQVTFRRQSRTSKLRARTVVLTTPLGVLQKSPNLLPYPEMKKAVDAFHMGHVQRINFKFQHRFWEDLSDKPVSFLHTTPAHYFPTWWSQMPLRSPYLIAWQGGPKALEISTWSEDQKIDVALRTLSTMVPLSVNELKKQVLAVYTHDWSKDPYALGAYSYVGVSDNKQYDFSKPFKKNIWISGELAASGADRGTIHGAMQAADLCSRNVIKYLNRK